MKQSKLRRRRVFRFAVLYFVLFIVFLGLIIGPIFAGRFIPPEASEAAQDLMGLNLYQKNDQERDNTDGRTPTGIDAGGAYTGKFTPSATASPKATSEPDSSNGDP